MADAQREGLQAKRYPTENFTAYLIHSPGASRATMMILTRDRENILILSAYCSDCPVPVSKLIDLVNKIKFI